MNKDLLNVMFQFIAKIQIQLSESNFSHFSGGFFFIFLSSLKSYSIITQTSSKQITNTFLGTWRGIFIQDVPMKKIGFLL